MKKLSITYNNHTDILELDTLGSVYSTIREDILSKTGYERMEQIEDIYEKGKDYKITEQGGFISINGKYVKYKID